MAQAEVAAEIALPETLEVPPLGASRELGVDAIEEVSAPAKARSSAVSLLVPARASELDEDTLAGVLVVPPEWSWRQEDGGTLEFVSESWERRELDLAAHTRVPGFGICLAWQVDCAPPATYA